MENANAGNERIKTDIAWKYGYLADPSNKNNITCNYCSMETKGGIFRFKKHLVGGYRDIRKCSNCPEHVREEIKEYMEGKTRQKEQLNFSLDIDQVFPELDDEEDEVLLSTADLKGKRAINQIPTSNIKRPRQVGPMDSFVKPKPSITVGKGAQSTINQAYKKDQREKTCADLARWMYDAGISFNAVNYPSFKVALNSIASAGIGMKPPSAYEVRVPFLRKEVQNIDELMKTHREEWARTGCSVMSDGWTDRCQKPIINFLVNCSKGSMFLESVDASSYVKTGEKLFELLISIVQKVGESNVVQVITDNGSNYVAAGKLLEARFPHLYWTPCAAHCIDLMLEDIGKIASMNKTIKRAIQVSSFIYQRPGLLSLMRQFTGQKNLLRPAKTRFATAFITLSSIHKHRDGLRKLFTCQEWVTSRWAKEPGGKRASQTILMPHFWNGVVYCLKLSGPLVGVLRLVDGEKKPPMGYIYEAMDRAKEAIATAFDGNESKYSEVYEIIDKRWDCQLHHPLHAAAYYLNPEFFYSNPDIQNCKEVIEGLYACIERLVPELEKQDKITDELPLYRRAEGLFGNAMAIRHRKTKSPAEWWAAYGASTPTLQQFAIKILSLTCSASGCERNWSVFEQIHSKKRNRLAHARLNDLVYVKYNRALVERYKARDKLDPISLKEIDESNEWLTGRMEDDGAEDDLVFEDDENLNWGQVASAVGVHEERFNFRSGSRQSGSNSSSQKRLSLGDVEEEKDDDGYQSFDGEEDVEVDATFNEEDDYI